MARTSAAGTAGFAATGSWWDGCCRSCPAPASAGSRNPLSALSQWKLFDNLRRSLVPAGLTCCCCSAGRCSRMPGCGRWSVIAILLLPSASAFILDLLRKPDEVLLRQHLAATARRGRPARRSNGADARLPPLRGDGQPRCDRPHRVADARHASTASRMESVRRRRTRSSPLRRHDRAAPHLQRRSSRCGSLRSSPPLQRSCWRYPRPSALAEAAPILFLWFVSPGHRMVDQPAARSPRSATDDGPDALPPKARAKDMGVLRDLRRSGRPMASAGQLPGTSGRQRRAPHIADEHGTCAAGESDGLRFRLHPGRTTHPAHGECDEHDEDHGTARGPLLQLVRHAVAEAAAAALCLGGGQREPRGPSDDVAAGTSRARRRQDPGCDDGSKA